MTYRHYVFSVSTYKINLSDYGASRVIFWDFLVINKVIDIAHFSSRGQFQWICVLENALGNPSVVYETSCASAARLIYTGKIWLIKEISFYVCIISLLHNKQIFDASKFVELFWNSQIKWWICLWKGKKPCGEKKRKYWVFFLRVVKNPDSCGKGLNFLYS